LDELKKWMEKNYEGGVKSVSFLLRDNHGFVQAPYESITGEEYQKMAAKVKPLNEVVADMSGTILENIECSNGVCPVR